MAETVGYITKLGAAAIATENLGAAVQASGTQAPGIIQRKQTLGN